ncbi:MAG: GNAT family N-acetyltransferase [Alphaproteobacteria bacterium]|nr:GNAT family N-acetyltransferase [Alphaproteobacteria bacterium]
MQSLAKEIERTALEDLHDAASPELRASLGIESRTIGSAFVSIASALPASAIVVNRALGLGHRAPESEDTIRQIVEAYRSAGVARYFVQVHPDARPRQIGDWLLERGLERVRGWQKFSRGRDPVPDPRTDLTIREIGTSHGAASAAILSDAFDMGDQARPWLARLPGRDRWHIFMTFDGDQPAGTGALFIDGEVAWTDFGATAPDFRRRGSQSALLRHRVQFALDRGCRQIFTCTGEAVPGDPQHSYSNILKAGFKEDYVRPNYAPPR